MPIKALWSRFNNLWESFENAPFGKFLINKIFFRPKTFWSILSAFGFTLVVQLSVYHNKSYLVDKVNELMSQTEGFWYGVLWVISFIVPEGNIYVIIGSSVIILLATIIRYKELIGEKINKIFTTESLAKYATEPTIGRDKNIEEIETLLQANKSLLLIHSMGGIGKSALARYYFDRKKDEFNYVGFVEAGADLRTKLIAEVSSHLSLVKTQSIEEQFNDMITKLGNLNGKKLLVIDDIKSGKEQSDTINKLMSLTDHGFKLLFTSRHTIDNITSYELQTLEMKYARELFLRYYMVSEGEYEKIEKIISHIDRHTYFIILIAKTMKNCSYTPDAILEKFQKGELHEIKNIEDGEITTLNYNLKELFDMQQINNDSLLLLKKLSILPSIEIESKFLQELIDDEMLIPKLNDLCKNGLLIEGEGSYKLHQIIRDYIHANHTPTQEELEPQLEYFDTMIRASDPSDPIATKNEQYDYYHTLARFIDKQNYQDKRSGDFLGRLGYLLHHQGSYATALEYLQKSLAIYQAIGDRSGEGTTLNNISQMYNARGDLTTALEYLQKSLAVTQAIGDKSGEGTTLNNIATIHNARGDLTTALEYLQKSLAIRQAIGDRSGMCATLFNIGHIHLAHNEKEEAVNNWVRVYKIAKEIENAQALGALERLAKKQGHTEGLGYWEALSQRGE